MKYIIFIVLFFCMNEAFSQAPVGVPTQKINGWIENWYTVPDSGTVITRRDTLWVPRFFGTAVTWPRPGVDTTQWYWVGNHWLQNGNGKTVDTLPLHNQIILKLNISDTASMLLPYLRKADTTNKWVQNVYSRNDSLFKQKNGSETFINKFSTGAGTVTSVGLSMPSAFNVSPSTITTNGTFGVTGAGLSSEYIKGNGTIGTTDTGMMPNFYLKVRGLLSGSNPISYNSTSGIISVLNANAAGQKGVATFSSTDFLDNGLGLISIRNNPGCDIKKAGADTTGTVSASGVIQNLINAGCKLIYAPAGIYLLDTTIQMKDSVSVFGDGAATLFKINKNIPGFKCGWALGGSKTTFQNISFIGTFSDSTFQDGIFADSSNAIVVSSVRAYKMAGAAIRMRRTGFCCGMYTSNAVRGNVISDCYFDSCQVGVKVDTVAEFITIANTTCTNGGIGIFTAAGSTNISSCRLGKNSYGIYMTGGSNNSHGTCENTHLPHNTQYGIYITGASNGYRFVGNMIRQSSTAEIFIDNSTNISFSHNDIGTGAIVVSNCSGTKFIDNLYWGPPVWTITGTAPTVVQDGEILNTSSIKDVLNSKQFDVTHSDGIVDFAGTGLSRIRMKNDTLNFSTSGTQHFYAGGENSGDSLILMSTTHATKGLIKFGSDPTFAMYYNDVTKRLGLDISNPSSDIHVRRAAGSSAVELRLQCDIVNTSSAPRLNLINDLNHGLQLFQGSSVNAFAPDGALIHTSGTAGMRFAADAGDIIFNQSTTPGVSEYSRFKLGTGSFLFGTTTDDAANGRFKIHSRATIDSLLRLLNVTAPPSTYNVLVHGLTDSGTYQVPLSTVAKNANFTYTVDAQYVDANNSGTSVTDLYSKSVPASTLTSDGARLSFEAAGTFNDATATVNLQLLFAGNSMGGTGAISLTGASNWTIRGKIWRTSSSTARMYVSINVGSTTAKIFESTSIMGGLDFTVANILKLTGQATGAGGGSDDITGLMWDVTYYPAP